MFLKNMKQDGFKKTFFTGYTKQIQFNILRNITFFPLFEHFKKKYQINQKSTNSKNIFKQTFYATSMTRLINSFVLFPIEILRIETQLSN